MQDDDDDLWQRLAETITPLKTRNTPQKRMHATRLVRQVMIRDTPPRMATPPQARPSPIPPRQVKKLVQQKIPVEASIDLHGMNVERAHGAVLRFLNGAVLNELRCIEIVTGRGDPHRGTGQLKRLVPFWLDDPQWRGHILHIAANPASRGGSLLVLLRRNRTGY